MLAPKQKTCFVHLYIGEKKILLDTKWNENILYHLINIRSLRRSLDH